MTGTRGEIHKHDGGFSGGEIIHLAHAQSDRPIPLHGGEQRVDHSQGGRQVVSRDGSTVGVEKTTIWGRMVQGTLPSVISDGRLHTLRRRAVEE